ncbi:hypothetical protein J8Z24_18225 [Pseudoalteromonas sp. SCSIO 43201]|uniref:DUF6037 family protein n=1 Tax=Pseudoalteromonas sp. SCSIO 43201 TaxID=2822842 RepID=UPI0020756F96|nr:DUF6037 family protein [Pseudoalteromonas sp. SCSIO 43201]USD30898.1 hypothetical protein J8Z24_18225 [Pseudoalteromonas sp. SCSIO 43201]
MKMTALEALHKSMLKIPTDVQQFPLKLGATSFSCLFTTRCTEDRPYFGLSLTSKGANPTFILFDVKPGYYISPAFEEDTIYYPLLDALRTHGMGGKLYPKEFLKQLNDALPKAAQRKSIPSPKQIIDLRPDIVEDRKKSNFWYWKPWPISNDPNKPSPPSKENRHKTLMLLGPQALRYSEHTNSSSCWTADESKATEWDCPSQ